MSFEVYIPPDGLQGQKIPGHILWSGIEVQSVSMEWSAGLVLLETFNALPDAVTTNERKIVVTRTVTDGYFGFVFQSERTDALDSTTEVRVTITPRTGEPVSSSHTVRLFRASISVASSPGQIDIADDGTPSAQIELSHEGHGTLLVTIETATESKLELVIPERLTEAARGFEEDIEHAVEVLRKKYPQYKKVFEPLDEVVPKGSEAVVEALRAAYEEVEGDIDFAGDVDLLISEALLRNSDFELMVITPILDYLKSVVSGGVILAMPWREFTIPEGESHLVLTVTARDVMNAETVNMTLEPIMVRSHSAQRIALDRLVGWRGIPRESATKGAKRPRESGRRRVARRGRSG